MKILKNIIIAIVVLVVLVMIIGYLSPQNVTLQRSISISATPASIFEEVNGMKAFNQWNPWASIDPEGTTYNFEGPNEGVGSKMSWASDHSDVGNGVQEIIESERNTKVRTKLDFDGYPTSYAEFQLTGDDGSTTVTWTFEGDMGTNPIGRIFGLFMESMLGPSYEQGLNNLKSLAESKPKFSIDPNVAEVETINYIGIRKTFSMANEAAIGNEMGALYGQLQAHMQRKGIAPTGQPMSVHYTINDSIWDTEISFPVNEADAQPGSGGINSGQTYAGKVLAVTHMGDYMLLDDTHKEIKKYMEYKNLTAAGNAYEIYVTDPGNVPDTAQWKTEIYYPIN